MRPSTAKLLTVLCVAALSLPLVPGFVNGVVPGPKTEDASYFYVYLPVRQQSSLAGSGLTIVQSYEGFALVRGTAATVAAMPRLVVAPADDLFTLNLNQIQFDVREGPSIPDALRIEYAPQESGMHIVHFLGPVKDEWRWNLERAGASVERYVPNNAFIVRMTPETANLVRGLPAVDYVGPLHPAFRVHPDLLATDRLVEVKIVTFKDEKVDPVLAFLGHRNIPTRSLGVGLPGVISWTQAEDFGVVKARVPATLLPEVARLRGVEYVEPIFAMDVANTDMQWIHQSFQNGIRTEWSASPSLDGTGQIIAVADSGLDFDHEQFRESDATIQLGGINGPGSVYNTTDMARRKLIRYYPMAFFNEGKPWWGASGDIHAGKDSPWDSVFSGCRAGHGTAVTSVAAGNDNPITIMSPGLNDGIALGAKIFFEDIGTEVQDPVRCTVGSNWDIALSYIPDDYSAMFQPAYDAGARIHTNSWGSPNADYDLEGHMVDLYMWQHPDFLVIFSNGNNGPALGTVGSPAVNKDGMGIGWGGNANNCGGSDENSVSGQSSRGTTLDGRAKPDIVAVGEGRSAQSDSPAALPTNSVGTADVCWAGTSYAGPAAAGGAAITRQYLADGWWPTGTPVLGNQFSPSAAQMKALMMSGARKMTGAGTSGGQAECGAWHYPSCSQGFGRYTLDDSLHLAGEARDTYIHDYKSGLTTGQTFRTTVWVNGNTQSLRFVLAYTDYPGAIGASPALVNNLNLRLIAPDGTTTFKGNCWGTTFAASDSRADPSCGSYDSVNPVEGVLFSSGSAQIQNGEWTIEVTAQNVPVGTQPFALAVTGDLDLNYGAVTTDKPEYTEGDNVTLRVVDLNAGPTVDVDVISDTETTPETVTLPEIGDGIYEGPLPIGFDFTTNGDGTLQVSDGDTITAMYNDGNPAHISMHTATVEAVYPIISNVRVTALSNSAATISWNTLEPANGTVYYGPTAGLGFSAQEDSGAELRVAHSLTVTNLTTQTLYYYDVASTDRAGHTSVDDFGGPHYRFQTSQKGEVLLVIGDSSFPADRLQFYRDALADRKWALNEWDITTQGMPTLALLRDYKAVLWQVGLEQYPPVSPEAMLLLNNLAPAATDDYVDGGGRLMISGHDIAWALCATSGSQWYNAANCNWVHSTLKATYQDDPSIINQLNGIVGNPISGSYTTGACYARHRDGGSTDEIDKLFGGETAYTWRNNDVTPDDVAVQWTSPLANGSALPGSWWWKGTPSKVVAFFFEFSGLFNPSGPTPCADNPAARADILNKTVVWMIGRDHPWVKISVPNGGSTYSTSPLAVSWTRSSGAGILSQEFYYSDDDGQSWTNVPPTLSGGDTSKSWDISALPNGKYYKVRVVATDAGTPELLGGDDSDSDFTIDRGAAGDLLGPLTWSDSPRASPNPATTGSPVTFRARVDDSARGNANIHATTPAEYYIDVDPGVGSATAMILLAMPTSPTEEVTWTGPMPFVSFGWHDLCVRGQDVYGNWGVSVCTPFFVLTSGPPLPAPPTNVHASLVLGGQDVNLTWTPSAPETDVTHYEIWRGAVYSPTGAGYTVLPPPADNLPLGTDRFADVNPPLGQSFFYIIRAVGPGGFKDGDYQAAKYVTNLAAGMTLLSVPLQLQDTSAAGIFQSLAVDRVRLYDSTDATDPWKAYYPAKPSSEFNSIDYRRGLWVDSALGGEWRIAGRVPRTTSTAVVTGWNLVAYDSFIARTAGAALAPLSFGSIEQYSAADPPYHLKGMAPSEMMGAGRAYWIYFNTPGTWTVTNT